MEDFVNDTHDACCEINRMADYLNGLAVHFGEVGNDKVSANLFAVADNLIQQSETINKAVGKEITDQLHNAEQSAKNTVQAALAGVELQKQADES